MRDFELFKNIYIFIYISYISSATMATSLEEKLKLLGGVPILKLYLPWLCEMTSNYNEECGTSGRTSKLAFRQ